MNLRLYSDLAVWWPLFSPPSHYVEEAAELLNLISSSVTTPPGTLLELGSGGGSLAYHLKPHFRLTLTDVSPQMLEQNRAVNPEAEHIVGDMRTLRLERRFDVVLIHDAIMYLTEAGDVRAALETARRHCRPGGLTVLLPDCVKETFVPATESGGEDAPDGRGFRYLEWTWDPDPADSIYQATFAVLLRQADGRMQVEMDQHRFGLFPRADWLDWLGQAGFSVRVITDSWARDVFLAAAPD